VRFEDNRRQRTAQFETTFAELLDGARNGNGFEGTAAYKNARGDLLELTAGFKDDYGEGPASLEAASPDTLDRAGNTN
jgi:hypothetical protein